ncbi:hypothetical protein GCM10009780_70340 [Actinomadura alba]
MISGAENLGLAARCLLNRGPVAKGRLAGAFPAGILVGGWCDALATWQDWGKADGRVRSVTQ